LRRIPADANAVLLPLTGYWQCERYEFHTRKGIAMKKRFGFLAGAIFAVLPMAGSAAPINVDTLYSFGFGGIGTPITGTNGGGFISCTNPVCVDSPVGMTFEFTLTGVAQLIVQDLFLSTDQFVIYDIARGLLGLTSSPVAGGSCGSDFACASSDPRYSLGVFNLGPGSYSIGGTQVAGTSGAGAFIIQTITPIPVPASLPLLAAGLLALGLLRRRKTY
jgi:hypothetical protein